VGRWTSRSTGEHEDGRDQRHPWFHRRAVRVQAAPFSRRANDGRDRGCGYDGNLPPTERGVPQIAGAVLPNRPSSFSRLGAAIAPRERLVLAPGRARHPTVAPRPPSLPSPVSTLHALLVPTRRSGPAPFGRALLRSAVPRPS